MPPIIDPTKITPIAALIAASAHKADLLTALADPAIAPLTPGLTADVQAALVTHVDFFSKYQPPVYQDLRSLIDLINLQFPAPAPTPPAA